MRLRVGRVGLFAAGWFERWQNLVPLMVRFGSVGRSRAADEYFARSIVDAHICRGSLSFDCACKDDQIGAASYQTDAYLRIRCDPSLESSFNVFELANVGRRIPR
jgi:hypothetical protein